MQTYGVSMIFNYFDDWVVVMTDDDFENITGFKLCKKQEADRVETILW